MAIMCQPHHMDKEGAIEYYSTYVGISNIGCEDKKVAIRRNVLYHSS